MHEWTKEEVQIIKAAWATDAGRVALEVIVGRIAGLHGTTYNDNALRMAHSEGRRSVGHDLMRAINLKIENVVKEHHEPRSFQPASATELAARITANANSGRKRAGKSRT